MIRILLNTTAWWFFRAHIDPSLNFYRFHWRPVEKFISLEMLWWTYCTIIDSLSNIVPYPFIPVTTLIVISVLWYTYLFILISSTPTSIDKGIWLVREERSERWRWLWLVLNVWTDSYMSVTSLYKKER
jgi:hypothetical protein